METWIQWITKASLAQGLGPCPSDRTMRTPGQQKGYFHRIGPASHGGEHRPHQPSDLAQGFARQAAPPMDLCENAARHSGRRVAAL